MIKPMLAAKANLNTLRYPVLVSPKLDGIRALIVDGVVMSRTLKPIPNEYVQKQFGRPELNGLDGELIVGLPTDPDVYRNTTSGVMRKDGEPPVSFYAFDRFDMDAPFKVRLESIDDLRASIYWQKTDSPVFTHPHHNARDPEELIEYEQRWVGQGYEGVILRDPAGRYKYGRSTAREQGMLKVKRFEDSEAEVLEVLELMHNENEAKTNALGRTERSSHKENKRGADTMGKLRVRDVHTGVEFHVGTGFSSNERKLFWHAGGRIVGRVIKYKYFAVGVKDLPRHPVYLGMRERMDFDEVRVVCHG